MVDLVLQINLPMPIDLQPVELDLQFPAHPYANFNFSYLVENDLQVLAYPRASTVTSVISPFCNKGHLDAHTCMHKGDFLSMVHVVECLK